MIFYKIQQKNTQLELIAKTHCRTLYNPVLRNPFQAKTRTTVLKNNSEHKCEQFAHQCNPLQTKCVLILNHLSKPVRNVRSFYNLIISTEALFNHSVFISQIMTIHQSKLSYTKTLPKTNFNVIPHLLGLSL
ncbi:Hypothetical_protein [Hexamita inflata]|uniref:Hypothetical_protein n=1 Tax=Hexamita inflata TaxID=28002 RepID=A0AA86UP10_9EUKA|nr:Hypothetical protein HINF_LOCUS46757 [Hexamita inflata]